MADTNLDMRPSGIPILGAMPWGSHFCQFYQTKAHLVDVLVPYFKGDSRTMNSACGSPPRL